MTASNEGDRLGEVYTIDEAASKLRVSRTTMMRLMRLYPHFSKCGHVYRFSEADILAIWSDMRSEIEPRQPPQRHAAGAPRSTYSPTKLAKLLTGKPRPRPK